jgi:hypothetical protein
MVLHVLVVVEQVTSVVVQRKDIEMGSSRVYIPRERTGHAKKLWRNDHIHDASPRQHTNPGASILTGGVSCYSCLVKETLRARVLGDKAKLEMTAAGLRAWTGTHDCCILILCLSWSACSGVAR